MYLGEANVDPGSDAHAYVHLGKEGAPGLIISRLGCVQAYIYLGLAAVPYIVQNPVFIGYVLELAALSRAGITPADMFERTGRYL